MRKILLVFVMTITCVSLSAQNRTSNPGEHPVYCTVMGYNFWGVGKVKVQLDLGRKTNAKGFDSLYGADGKKMKFNTMMEVLNYMGERGWRCIDNYFLTRGKSNVVHYLLEKWVNSDDEITEGLSIKEDDDKEPWAPGKGSDDMY